MAGRKGQKKRFWSDDEKRSICDQASLPGVSVARVARRYSMNANLIHKWLRDPRFVEHGAKAGVIASEETSFLPVEIECDASSPSCSDRTASLPGGLRLPVSRVDITLSDGRRVQIDGPTTLTSVIGLVQGLMS